MTSSKLSTGISLLISALKIQRYLLDDIFSSFHPRLYLKMYWNCGRNSFWLLVGYDYSSNWSHLSKSCLFGEILRNHFIIVVCGKSPLAWPNAVSITGKSWPACSFRFHWKIFKHHLTELSSLLRNRYYQYSLCRIH